MLETDYAWAAGFLDGEGTFAGYAKYIRIMAFQSNLLPLRRLQEIFGFGFTVERRDNNQLSRNTQYTWVAAGGERVSQVLTPIIPYLVVKKDEGVTLLELADRMRSNRSRRLTQEEKDARQVLIDRLSDLKKRPRALGSAI